MKIEKVEPEIYIDGVEASEHITIEEISQARGGKPVCEISVTDIGWLMVKGGTKLTLKYPDPLDYFNSFYKHIRKEYFYEVGGYASGDIEYSYPDDFKTRFITFTKEIIITEY